MLQILRHLKESLTGEKIKWVEPDILHITLFFMGDTDEKLIPVIREKLQVLSRGFSPFDLVFSDVGIFKNIRDPRVIWIGTKDNPVIRALKSSIDKELTILGFKADDREFRPHLTIGRIKWIRNLPLLEEAVNSYKNYEVQRSRINTLIFHESILKPAGPEYIPIADALLGKGR